MKKIFFLVFVCLSFLCCKIDVKTPQKDFPAQTESPAEDPAPDPAPAPTPAPTPDPEPESQVRYELKTGPQINAILWSLYGDDVIGFLPSTERPPEGKTVYYLDIEEKNVMVWESDNWTKIYYYAEGVTTGDKNGKLVLNEDSSHFFEGCRRMENIDVSKFDTSSVVNMSQMFSNCTCLTNLDLSHFNTSKVTDMSAMFNSCEYLSELNISSFDTSNVKKMDNMFCHCHALKTLDLSSFVPEKVENMKSMFFCCATLESITFSNFNTINVKNMEQMFYYCLSLTDLDLSSFNTSNVTTMTGMFGYCKKLQTLNVSSFNTNEVTAMNGMFESCETIESLDLSSFNTQKVIDMELMFASCKALKNLDVSSFDTSNVSDMRDMFACCSSLIILDLSGFDFSQNGGTHYTSPDTFYCDYMFSGCSSLKTIYATKRVPLKSGIDYQICDLNMFTGCTSLVGGSGTTFDENHTDSTYARIDGGEDNPGFFTEVRYELKNGDAINRMVHLKAFLPSSEPPSDDISDINYLDIEEKNVPVWDDLNTNTTYYYAKGVTTPGAVGRLMMHPSAAGMFFCQQDIETIDISVFDSRNVTSMENMFRDCEKLKTVDISHFNTSKVTNMCMMFYNCCSLTNLDVSNFDTSNVENMDRMFFVCAAPVLDVSKFNTSKVTDMNQMFSSCSVTELDVSNFDTSKVKSMYRMFADSPWLETIIASTNFDTSSLEDGADMFESCASLVGGKGTAYDLVHNDSTYARIDGGPDSETPGYFTLKESTD